MEKCKNIEIDLTKRSAIASHLKSLVIKRYNKFLMAKETKRFLLQHKLLRIVWAQGLPILMFRTGSRTSERIWVCFARMSIKHIFWHRWECTHIDIQMLWVRFIHSDYFRYIYSLYLMQIKSGIKLIFFSYDFPFLKSFFFNVCLIYEVLIHENIFCIILLLITGLHTCMVNSLLTRKLWLTVA